jgi:hypothetical protein
MKRIAYIFAAIMLLASCNGKKPDGGKLTLEQQLYGEWHSTSLSITGDIYLDFNEDKTFDLYQQIGQGSYRLYRGTWGLQENLLTGKYNDGENWAYSYQVVLSGNTMTLTTLDESAQVSVFQREAIPAEVKDGSVAVVKSKAL